MATSKALDGVVDGTADTDMPELTPEMLRRGHSFSELLEARGIKRPGRPPSSNPKVRITIRLDERIVDHFKRKGAGWQTRLNEALAAVIEAEAQPWDRPQSRAGLVAKRAAVAKTAPAKKAVAKKVPAKKAAPRKAAISRRASSQRGKLTA